MERDKISDMIQANGLKITAEKLEETYKMAAKGHSLVL